MKTTPKFWRVLRFLFLGFFVVISIGPLIWIIMSSFKSNKEILSSAFALPSSFSLSGYKAALDMAPIFKFYGNSIIISVLSTLLNVVVVSMAAYVLARHKFKGSTFVTLLLSVSLLIPTAALLMPIYKIMTAIGLFDTRTGLILVYAALGLPTSLFIFKSYFQSIPKELEEAACIDGAGFFRTFFVIVFPLAKPGLATGAILQFLTSWNEFMFALILTKSTSVRTLPLALNYFTSQFSFNYTAMFAALTMVILPSIIIYILLQEQITSSMVEGSVKG
ncbi:carbohydrate ABC transporter permease [Dysosmobacter sp. Sow4_B12]|uniref:carbohydrate ABC transporter permease n=1 Tax=Dysosmobacter sp. Sow4_B12 TaxID=3438777 RepID=UPI003F8E3A9C